MLYIGDEKIASKSLDIITSDVNGNKFDAIPL